MKQSLKAQLEALSEVSQSIAKSMTTIPENQLCAAMLRGFQIWPYRNLPVVNSLSSHLQIIADQARATVGAEIAGVGVGRFSDHPFDPWVVSGLSEELRSKIGALSPMGVLGTVAIRGEKIRINDIEDHPDFRAFPPGHPKVKNFLAVPILAGSVSLGKLSEGILLE